MFTTAAVASSAATIIVSTTVDKLGPRVCGMLGAIILGLGSWIMSNVELLASIDGYVVGYMLIGLAGPFILLSTFQLSNMFPRHSGLVLALFTGACDASSGLFLAYQVEYLKKSISISQFFRWYMLVPVFVFGSELLIMPKNAERQSMGAIARSLEQQQQRQQLDEDADETTSLLPNRPNEYREIDFTHGMDGQVHFERRRRQKRSSKRQQRNESLNNVFKDPTEISGVWGALHHLAGSKQLTSPWFILILLVTAVQMIVINYFIETVFSQYQYLLKSESEAQSINDYFNVALPVGGVVAIPMIGILLDNLPTLTTFSLLTAVSVAIGSLGFVSTKWAAILRITLLVLYRPFYFTAVSDYTAKVFGFDTFGFVYGLVLTLAGLGNWAMVYFDFMTHRMFHKNPLPVNAVLTVASGTIGAVFVVFLWTQSKHIRRKQLEDEARHAPVQHMPGGWETDDEEYDSEVEGNGQPTSHTDDCRTGACENCVCEV